MRYTFVFDWPNGDEPRVGATTRWQGGRLHAVQFSDAIEELKSLNDFADLCDELAHYLPPPLRYALAKIRPPAEEDETHNATVSRPRADDSETPPPAPRSV